LKVAPKGLGDGLGSDLVTKQDDGQPLPIDKTIGGDTPQAASERTGAAPADEALKAKPSAGEATEDREVVCKKGVDTREGRRRPTETTLSIHKIKKDEGLAATATVGGAISTNAAVEGSGTSTAKRNIDDIPHLMSQLRQPNINDDQLLGAVRGLRRLLSVKGDVPAGEVLEIGALPAFVQMLQPGINSAVQFEAAWALTNIASTDKTYVIVDAGAVQPLINLLTSPDERVREQCAWCLGNISGDSAQLRDAVLSAGGMQPLLQNISQPENKSLLSNSVWALSNLCRGKPGPPLSSIAPALPVIKNLLPVGSLLDDKADLLWSLSYISDGDDANIQAVIDAGVVEMLVDILGQDNSALVTPALRTIGNLVSGSDAQTEFCLEAGLMPKMRLLINHEKKNVRKEAAWVLSNIAAGTRAQIGQVLSSGRMQDVLSLSLEAVWEIRMECIWVLSNIAYGGSDEQVASLVSLGAIPSLVTALDMNETKMTIVALEALESILEVGDRQGDEYVSLLDESNGISTIESLQEHESEQVYNKALEIIEKFLGVDEHEEG